jgi:hypothetical protein
MVHLRSTSKPSFASTIYLDLEPTPCLSVWRRLNLSSLLSSGWVESCAEGQERRWWIGRLEDESINSALISKVVVYVFDHLSSLVGTLTTSGVRGRRENPNVWMVIGYLSCLKSITSLEGFKS